MSPVPPTIRRPHRFPQRRMTASENHPPAKQASTPKPKGNPESQPIVAESRPRWFFK